MAEAKVKRRGMWMKRVLVPLWTIAFCVTCLALTIAEIILFSRRYLKPLAHLSMEVVKSTVWVVLFLIDVVSVVRQQTASYRASSGLYVLIGVCETIIVLLSFLATMIYASVIYHRHRHGLPYHLRDIRAKEAEEERRKNSPGNTFGDTEAGITADANSLATTGRSTNGAIEAQAAQELGNNVEIMELDTEHKNPFQGRQRGTISINKKPRELQGDKAEVELSSQKSPKSSRKGSDKREKLAELEGDARWPDSQSKL
ncbi:MAG: hypothetical protein LQ351_005760 [Letrouitia transgressa]|nr:MAG: hypothetical protein LQ351_005760 [Letrouitia transgressa]